MQQYPQKQYLDEEIATASTLPLWQSVVTRATSVEGIIVSDEALTLTLQSATPTITPEGDPVGVEVATSALDTDWITLDTADVEADTPFDFSWQLVGRHQRLLLGNASDSTATITAEINVRA